MDVEQELCEACVKVARVLRRFTGAPDCAIEIYTNSMPFTSRSLTPHWHISFKADFDHGSHMDYDNPEGAGQIRVVLPKENLPQFLRKARTLGKLGFPHVKQSRIVSMARIAASLMERKVPFGTPPGWPSYQMYFKVPGNLHEVAAKLRFSRRIYSEAALSMFHRTDESRHYHKSLLSR